VSSANSKIISSEWTLPLHKTPWYWIYYFTLFTWLSTIVRSYFSHKGLSSIDIPTNVSRGFEVYFFKIRHNQVEANIKNWLPHNFSLFTTLSPSKIWQPNLKNQQLVCFCKEACNINQSKRRSHWCCVIRYAASFANNRNWQSTTVMIIFKPHW